jgi:hypothetical protein
MGNQVVIKLSLDTSFADFPKPGKKHSTEVKGNFIFPPDKVFPFYNNGKVIGKAIVESYTRFDKNRTIVSYKLTEDPFDTNEFCIEFNWIVKLRDPDDLESRLVKGAELEFNNPNDPCYRDYPVGIPIELWRYPKKDEKYLAVALAKINLTQITVGNGTTHGKYKILNLYDEKLRDMISKNFI